MNLPENGRVIVVDDKIIEEGLPLIKALSKNGVPVTFFTGISDELPDQPLPDVRIIFLDIVLGTEGQSDKTKISTAVGVINRLIGNDNTYAPYLIIAWTKHEELIEGIKQSLRNNPPVFILDLEKNECKDGNGEYAIPIIENKLKEKLKEAKVFQLFIIWENLVHKASGKIVRDFSSFYKVDDNWNEKMSGIFYKLASAYTGRQIDDKKVTVNETIKNALLTFNGTFLDTLENEIRSFADFDEASSIQDRSDIENKILAGINSKLLLLIDQFDNPEPGCVYADENKEFTLKIDELFNGELVSFPEKDNLIQKLKHIFIEVSPSCDYAQDKWRVHRVIRGLMWPMEYFKKIKKADYIYTSPILEIENVVYKLVFDLRYLTSLPFEQLKGRSVMFKARHELLVDIQANIARHINRPGVISLE